MPEHRLSIARSLTTMRTNNMTDLYPVPAPPFSNSGRRSVASMADRPKRSRTALS